ncbi:hypothetical protein HYH03_011303 [Edaphochlamys debaryana]|uniref:Uncharacterized protein n=1 Tax=Edaphochlamys debaryana TaxID=47281 RepID=A0A835XTW6_9CHLO|nr:hypothetical protein HYH03_011303 [Edaphochlamys debaryana]|eukprot:KAG2490173.1 hypothetical protein HYH03_011303 [Edaphochlamys debaryana]
MDRVRCDPGLHTALHECDFAGWGMTDCTEYEGVVVLSCYPGDPQGSSPPPTAPPTMPPTPPLAPSLPPAPPPPPRPPPRGDLGGDPPPVSHSCRVSIVGPSSDGGGTQAQGSDGVAVSVRCWREPSYDGAAEEAVQAEAGAELLAALGANGGGGSGLALSAAARSGDAASSAAAGPDTAPPGPDWGLTFSHVPHLRLVDSVLSDLSLSAVGSLLAFRNVTQVTLSNVTLLRLSGPTAPTYGYPPPTVYGAVAVGSAQYVSLAHVTCDGVVEAAGWACLHVTLQPGALLYVASSTFSGNHVPRPGHYDTSCNPRPGQYGELTRSYGLGAVVIVHEAGRGGGGAFPAPGFSGGDSGGPRQPSAPAPSAPLEPPPSDTGQGDPGASPAAGPTRILVDDSSFVNSTGGCGTAFTLSFRKPATGQEFYGDVEVDLSWTGTQLARNAYVRPDLEHRGPVRLSDGAVVSGSTAGRLGGFAHCTGVRELALHAASLINCTAGLSGGVVSAVERVDSLIVSGGARVDGNRARTYGGAVYSPAGLPFVLITGNTTSLSGNAAGDRGGAVYTAGTVGNVSLEAGAVASGNSAGLSGGLLYAGGAISTLRLTDGSRASTNTAKLGGAVFAEGDIGAIAVASGAALSGNAAATDGGAVFAGGTLASLRLEGGGGLLNNTAADRGGAVLATAIANVSGQGCVVSGNMAARGGAVFSGRLAFMALEACTLLGNAATRDGGFLHAPAHAAARWHVLRSRAQHNTAGRCGGVFFAPASGEALAAAVAADQPFGASQEPLLLELNGSTLEGNSAADSGGALVVAAGGSVRTLGGSFEGNAAFGQGGGAAAALAAEGADSGARGGQLWLEGASFSGNLAPVGSGGAVLAAAGSAVRLSGCELTDNAAAVDGGAMACDAAAALALQGCLLAGNLALGSGGGISTAGCDRVAVDASLLGGNVASSGGALSVGPSAVSNAANANTAMSRRSLGGVAASSHPGLVWVSNSTLSGNLAARATPPPAIAGAATGLGGGLVVRQGAAHVLLASTRLVRNAAWLGADVASTQTCGTEDGEGSVAQTEAALAALAVQLLALGPEAEAEAGPFWQGLDTGVTGAGLASASTCSLFIIAAAEPWLQGTSFVEPVMGSVGVNASRVFGAGAPNVTSTMPAFVALAAALPLLVTAPVLAPPEAPAAAAWMAQPDLLPLRVLCPGAPELTLPYPSANASTGAEASAYPCADAAAWAAKLEGPPAELRLACGPRSSSNGGALSTTGALACGGQARQLSAKTGVPWVLAVRLYDSFGRPVSSVAAATSGAGTTVAVRTDGTAEWRDLRVTGWPGEYELAVRVEGPTQVSPLVVQFTLTGCDVGEAATLDASSLALPFPPLAGISCVLCPRRQVGLLPDARAPLSAWGALQQSDDATGASASASASFSLPPQQRQELQATASFCNPCPSGAVCPGGALVVPPPGRWHSAHNSPRLHECLNPDACSGLTAAAAAALRSYPATATATLGSTLELLGALEDRALLLAVCQDQARLLQAFLASSASNSSSSFSAAVAASDAASPPFPPLPPPQQQQQQQQQPVCVLSGGSRSSDPRSYAQLQCAEGYTGNLCAACQPGYSLSTDFQCDPCPTLTRTLALGIITLVVSCVFVVVTAMINLGEDNTDGVANSGDIVKILVVHMQYFVIIARLNVDRPPTLRALTAALSTITGAENLFTFSASCLAPDSGSGDQALASLLSAIVMPMLVTAGALLLWSVRYALFNTAVLRRSQGLMRSVRVSNSGVGVLPVANSGRGTDGTTAPAPKSRGLAPDPFLPRASTSPGAGKHTAGAAAAGAGTPPEAGTPGPRAGSWAGASNAAKSRGTAGGPLLARTSTAADRVKAADAEAVAEAVPDEHSGEGEGTEAPDAVASFGSKATGVKRLASNACGAEALTRTGAGTAQAASKPGSSADAGDEAAADPETGEAGDAGAGLEDSAQAKADATKADAGTEASPKGGAGANAGGPKPAEPEADNDEGGLSYRPSQRRSRSSAARRIVLALKLGSLTAAASSAASFGSRLAHADQALSLRRQLAVVAMIAAFVLYPAWAAAGFSVFACCVIDEGGSGPLDQLEQATHRWGYWARDMNQECYVGTHAGLYVPLGVVTLLVFCLGPPAVTFALMWRIRHRLKDYHIERTYGYLYSRYRKHVCWWDASVQLQTLALVAVDVFGQGLNVAYQALLLLAVLLGVGGINALVAPLASRLLRRLELSSSMVLCLTVTLSLYFAVGEGDFAERPEGTGVAVVILVLNLALIAAFAACLMRRAWPHLRKALPADGLPGCCGAAPTRGPGPGDREDGEDVGSGRRGRDAFGEEGAGADGGCARGASVSPAVRDGGAVSMYDKGRASASADVEDGVAWGEVAMELTVEGERQRSGGPS